MQYANLKNKTSILWTQNVVNNIVHFWTTNMTGLLSLYFEGNPWGIDLKQWVWFDSEWLFICHLKAYQSLTQKKKKKAYQSKFWQKLLIFIILKTFWTIWKYAWFLFFLIAFRNGNRNAVWWGYLYLDVRTWWRFLKVRILYVHEILRWALDCKI